MREALAMRLDLKESRVAVRIIIKMVVMMMLMVMRRMRRMIFEDPIVKLLLWYWLEEPWKIGYWIYTILPGVFFTKLIVAWHTDFNDGVVLIQKLIWYITLTIDVHQIQKYNVRVELCRILAIWFKFLVVCYFAHAILLILHSFDKITAISSLSIFSAIWYLYIDY